MLNKKEIYKLNFILNFLGKRLLPEYFYEKSPALMNKWSHQICRQAHVISCYFIDKWLNKDRDINYNVQFCESWFTDSVTKKNYDHSWVFISNVSNPKDCYICDIARISAHIGFIKSPVGNFPDNYIDDVEIPQKRLGLDFNMLLQEREYYTSKKGIEIIEDIENRLKENKLDNI